MTPQHINQPVTVLVVDDHNLFRRGLIALLSKEPRLKVIGEAGDASEATRRAAELKPDIILLDNHLPGVNGIDALPGLREVVPTAKILMLTVSEDAQDLAHALKAGAAGYILKTVESDWLVTAMLRAAEGESVVSPEMTSKLIAALRAQTDPVPRIAADDLSPREKEILCEVARGHSNKEVGRRLGIADTTVKAHVQNVFHKLKLDSRVRAAVYAVEHGLI